MPTFVLRCPNCGHDHSTPITTRYEGLGKIMDAFICQECGGRDCSNILQGGTGFQLSQRDVKGSVGSARGSGFSGRGRCFGRSL